MKKTALTLLIGFIFAEAFPQKVVTQEIRSDIQSVIVYLDGAEINRSKQVKLAAGRNQLIFKGLSHRLNSKSIQITATGDVSILAISSKLNYLSKVNEKPKIKHLKDSVELINHTITALNDERGAYKIEKEMLLKNQAIGGNEKGVSIMELKQASDFYRNRIKDINSKTSKIDRELKKKHTNLNRMTSQLRELNAQNTYQRTEVTVLLIAKTALTSALELKYIVNNAGWAPSYDLIGTDIDKSIELKYRAKVFNNTGIDWENLHMKLSTADPSLSAAKPRLSPWYLNYNTIQSANIPQGYVQSQTFQYNADIQRKEIIKDNIVYEEIEVSELSAEFDIKARYTIPSDAKPYLVEVTEYKLPATYKHFSIPKVDRDVFLLARITGWEDLNLVEGPANVYYGGTYIGQSYIYTRSTSDTLDLSLGRDNKVLITRTKLKEFSKTKFIGTNRKEFLAYELVIKNNRKSPIQIEVQDQLPVSQDSDIEVDIINISKAEHEVPTGKLKWNFHIPAGQTERINLAFSIKYPKNKPIKIAPSKKRMRAKF